MDFNDLEQDILKTAQTPATETQPQGPKPIRVDLGDGRVWDFKDDQELSTNLKQAFSLMTQQISELKEKAEKVEEPQGTYVQGDHHVPSPKFDNDKFIKMLGEDSKKAIEYLLPHTAYGAELKEARQKAEEATQRLEAENFLRANPEFPRAQYGDQLEKLRQQLGFEFNLQGLEATYAIARNRGIMPDFKMLNQVPQVLQQLAATGKIQFLDPQLQQLGQPQMQQYQGPQAPPPPQFNQNQFGQFSQPQYQAPHPGIPTIPRRNEVAPEVASAVDQMPLEQIEALLKKYGAI